MEHGELGGCQVVSLTMASCGNGLENFLEFFLLVRQR